MNVFDKISETKRLRMSVNDAVVMCAKAVNESPKFTLEEMDVENAAVRCIYTRGIFNYTALMGADYRITFVFNDDGNNGTICTGRIYNEYNKDNILGKPFFRKILSAAMELI